MSLTIEVTPILDSRSVDTRQFENVEVYNGTIDNEVMPPNPPTCFLGAWYRKVVSSYDEWLGIEGIIKLGKFVGDKERFNLDGKGRFMDNPSVYMGGKSQKESDAGLGWNLMYLDNNTEKDLELSSPKLGYRPFWRYIFSEALDTDGNVRRREVNSWNISNPRSLCYYYFPGDVIKMSVYSPIKDYLQLKIQIIKPTEEKEYVELRKKYGLINGTPLDFYSPIFYSKGHGYSKCEFKRVNSIDQYGNEGYHAKDTNAYVTEAHWQEVYLYRKVNNKLVKVPFIEERQCSMICPNEKAISVTKNEEEKLVGGEKITIHPGNVRK